MKNTEQIKAGNNLAPNYFLNAFYRVYNGTMCTK